MRAERTMSSVEAPRIKCLDAFSCEGIGPVLPILPYWYTLIIHDIHAHTHTHTHTHACTHTYTQTHTYMHGEDQIDAKGRLMVCDVPASSHNIYRSSEFL